MREQFNSAISVIQQAPGAPGAIALVSLIKFLPDKVKSDLEEAHSRYEHLIGITSGCFSVAEVRQDRADYPDFIKTSDRGMILFDDDECSRFMSAKKGMPVLLCRLHIAEDFVWTIASGFTGEAGADVEEGIDELCGELVNLLRDENAVKEATAYIRKQE